MRLFLPESAADYCALSAAHASRDVVGSKQDGPKKARARKDGGKAARGGRAAAGTTKAKRGLKKRS